MASYVYDYSASGGPSRVLNKNFAHGKWWGENATFSKQVSERQRFSSGIEFRDNFQQDQGNYDLQPFVQYFSDSRTSTEFSLFAQDEIRLHRNLILNLGLRYDHYSIFGGTTNPRAALIYNPWEKTTFKFLYGQSFRAPNEFELYYDAPGNEANAHRLIRKPSRLHGAGLGTINTSPITFDSPPPGFYCPIHGLINEQLDSATGEAFFANAGSLDLQGFDVALSRSLPGTLESPVSSSFQHVTNSTHMPVTNSSEASPAGRTLSVPLVKQKVFASVDLQYVSRRITLAGLYSGAYVVPNFTLFTRNVLKRWEISASLYNAFNQKYTDPSGNGLTEDLLVQDGRSFRVKIGYKFE